MIVLIDDTVRSTVPRRRHFGSDNAQLISMGRCERHAAASCALANQLSLSSSYSTFLSRSGCASLAGWGKVMFSVASAALPKRSSISRASR